MELLEEQKRRILEEEQQRLAEEQYRAQVRQELQNGSAATNPTLPVVEPPKAPKRHDPITLLLRSLLVIVLVIAGFLAFGLITTKLKTNASDEPYAPGVIETKHTEKIGSSQFVVSAGKVFYYRIPIDDARNIRISGHFLALGGQGNDIEVVLADEPNFGLWMDGRVANVYYASGKTTSGNIDVKFPALSTTLYLVFNNRFSALSAKTINADLDLYYSNVTLR